MIRTSNYSEHQVANMHTPDYPIVQITCTLLIIPLFMYTLDYPIVHITHTPDCLIVQIT